MNVEKLQVTTARAATRWVMEQCAALYRDDDCGVLTERVYARLKWMLECYEDCTARRTN